MIQDQATTQVSGNGQQRTGMIIMGLGVLVLIYGVVAAAVMTPEYRRLGRAYWDTLSSTELILATLWSVSFAVGSFLALVGGVLRAKVETSRKWIFIVGGVIALGLIVRFPWPTTSSPFFGVGGSLILVFLLLSILNWSKRRVRLVGEAKTVADLQLAGYMFLAFAAIYTCALGVESTFTFYPDEATHLWIQERAVGVLYRIMSLFVLGWFFTLLSQRKATHLVER